LWRDVAIKAAGGDEDAQVRLYGWGLKTTAKIVGRWNLQAADREDLCAVSALQLFLVVAVAGKYDGRPFIPWARTVLGNKARNAIRDAKRRTRLLGTTVLDLESCEWLAYSEPVPSLLEEAWRLIELLIDSMPDPDGAVVRGYMLGKPVSQIARDTGLSEAAVRQRFSRWVRRTRDEVARGEHPLCLELDEPDLGEEAEA